MPICISKFQNFRTYFANELLYYTVLVLPFPKAECQNVEIIKGLSKHPKYLKHTYLSVNIKISTEIYFVKSEEFQHIWKINSSQTF